MELSFIHINEHAHYEFPAVYENKTKCGDRRKCQYTYLRRHSIWKNVNYGKWWFVFHRYTRRLECWTFQSSPSNEVCRNEEIFGHGASGSNKTAGSRGTEASAFQPHQSGLKAVCRSHWTSLIRLVQGDPGGLWSQSLTGASGRGRIRQTLILSECFLVGSDNVRTF
uniref:Uncharacterized protein n=1 Tax=Magallana gigas TaxID=29159 RepID=A0A8W8LIZ2_MAGGI